ncbi:hypothetical protein RIF29_27687 [Crotalaria pallida]|uniref:NAC domain-containing protein n=1 Tax=Crotalaria pallida TaxID=3830 RepID=A0AAN9EWS2_CROPI
MEGDQQQVSNYTFPPGFRFHPTDEELIVQYLQNKISSLPLPANIIAEIDLYKHSPWDLPKKALFGEEEWYFFSPRDRKYPNGLRPNRAAASGYWKATGTDKPILTSCVTRKHIGVKKALVFYSGRPPKGIKTDWIMNEYRLVDTTTKSSRLKGSMRLDDWVLCRVRHKGYSSKNLCENQENPCEPNLQTNPLRSEEYPTNTNFQADMITDYQYKDYQIIASILVGGPIPIPPTENISSLSIKGSISNSLTSVYEDSFNKVNSQMTVSPSLDSYFNPLKRMSNEDDQYENLISFNIENKIDESPCKILTKRGLNCYNQNQSRDDIFSPPESSINFQELNELAFAGRYPQ